MNNELQDKYASNGFGRIGNAISQLGHAIAWGASDVSISGKTGYKSFVKQSKYWELIRKIVDFAFFPIDGQNHCKRAYLVDKDEKYTVGEGIYQDVICTIFVILVCPIVAIIAYPLKKIIK